MSMTSSADGSQAVRLTDWTGNVRLALGTEKDGSPYVKLFDMAGSVAAQLPARR